MSHSEIARLRQQIQDEYTAARRGLYEYATVGRHEIITNRFNQAGLYTDRLAELVGEEEALHISTRIYIQVSEEEPALAACRRKQRSTPERVRHW